MNHPSYPIVPHILALSRCGYEVRWNHIFREASQVAYALLKHGFNGIHAFL